MSTSLHDASRAGDLMAMRAAILSDPSAINSRDSHSRTPLHLAAWAGKTDAVKLLIEKKAVGASAMDDMAAIHFACLKGHTQVVRELLTHGASINSHTRKGMTPLHYAAQGNHKDLAVVLVRRGGNLNARTKAGKTPMELAKSQEIKAAVQEVVLEKSKKQQKEASDLASGAAAAEGDLQSAPQDGDDHPKGDDVQPDEHEVHPDEPKAKRPRTDNPA